ncbi:OB-fold nucleic acid binding domain-containing protein [Schaalia sp. 19OD2882]|nr:OB-fold nucleic acid binding domain-containing protein [Schaalia sp. 19OD2882]
MRSGLALAGASASREGVEAEDEDRARRERGRIAVCDVQERAQVVLFGSLSSMTFPPEGAAAVLRATLHDGTGTIELLWHGRRSIPGLHVGARVEVEGVAGRQGGLLTIVNPLYRLVAPEHE